MARVRTRASAALYSIRPLYPLKDADRQIEAWLDASASDPTGQPTAKQVAESVKKLLPQAPASDQSDSNSDGGTAKRETAILADGSKLPEVLWADGYLAPKLVQNALDRIRDREGLSTKTKMIIQKAYLQMLEPLNQATRADPSREMRNGIRFLLDDVLRHAPLVAAKPGDYLPERRPEDQVDNPDD